MSCALTEFTQQCDRSIFNLAKIRLVCLFVLVQTSSPFPHVPPPNPTPSKIHHTESLNKDLGAIQGLGRELMSFFPTPLSYRSSFSVMWGPDYRFRLNIFHGVWGRVSAGRPVLGCFLGCGGQVRVGRVG